ncbi:GntR family transcriptional regulator [Oerskovia turbata]
MSQPAGPLTEQLAQRLRDRILGGEVRGGDRLSELGVAKEFEVARPTARAALDVLVREGLATREPYAALRVTTVDPADVPEILALLEVVERLALDRILRDGPDLRPLRDTSRSRPEETLEALVDAASSSRLSRAHRQGTSELALAAGRRPPVPHADAARRLTSGAEALADALFRQQEDAAAAALGDLQDHRRTARAASSGPRFLRARSAFDRPVTAFGPLR